MAFSRPPSLEPASHQSDDSRRSSEQPTLEPASHQSGDSRRMAFSTQPSLETASHQSRFSKSAQATLNTSRNGDSRNGTLSRKDLNGALRSQLSGSREGRAFITLSRATGCPVLAAALAMVLSRYKALDATRCIVLRQDQSGQAMITINHSCATSHR